MSKDRERVLSAFMIETPATAPIYSRSIDAHMNSRVENIYREQSDQGRNNSESLVASIANSVLGYSTSPERRVKMPGGYRDSRFRVVIEYLETGMNNTEKVSYIVGYTDHDEAERGGSRIQFDPNMKVYFNNVSLVTRVINQREGSQKYRVNNRSQILTAPDVDDEDILNDRIRSSRTRDRGSRYVPMDGHLLIPSVVLGKMSHQYIPEMVDMPGIKMSDIDDSRSSLRMIGARRTNSLNAVPAHYLSKVLVGHDSVTRGNKSTDRDGPTAATKRLSDLQREVEDDTLSNSGFFSRLVVNTHYHDDGFVLWKDLVDLFPEMDDDRVCKATALASRYRDRPSTNQVAHWDSTDMETIIANIIVSSIPPMLTELLFDEIDFTITNETSSGKLSVVLEGYNSLFGDLDLTDQRDTLEYRIRKWVLDGHAWTDCPIHITGTLSTMYECAIVVEYDGGEPAPYRFANYADALNSALVSIDDGKIGDIATTLKGLMKVIDEKYEISTESKLMLPRSVLGEDDEPEGRDRNPRGGRDRDRELTLPMGGRDRDDDRRPSRRGGTDSLLSSILRK